MENEISISEDNQISVESDPNAEKVCSKKKKWIIMGAVLGGIVCIYLVLSLFFMNHYYFNTSIAGVSYSCQNQKKAEQQILNPSVDFDVLLVARDGKQNSISTDKLSMSYVFDDTLQRINESQNGFAWPVSLFKKSIYDLPVYISYDKQELTRELMQLDVFDKNSSIAPADAYISEYDNTAKGYTIVEENMGTTLDLQSTLASIEDAFKSMALGQKELILDLDALGCYVNPKLYHDDKALQNALKTANQYVSAQITYDWNGQEEIVDADVICQFVKIDGVNIVLDEDALAAYVKDLAKKNDTYGKNRMFTTTAGTEIELRSGAYGWKTDKEAETAALIEEIRKGEMKKKEPIYQCKGYVKGMNDIGNSYVEINLSLQHLYVYQSGAVVFESDFVSGNMSNGCGTPAGVFGITYKTKEAVLRGDNYETPVHYWMPFNGNIGMHDATWRQAFGGTIYQTSGSHGCVNLPLASAAVIYDYVETGFPIVCYY